MVNSYTALELLAGATRDVSVGILRSPQSRSHHENLFITECQTLYAPQKFRIFCRLCAYETSYTHEQIALNSITLEPAMIKGPARFNSVCKSLDSVFLVRVKDGMAIFQQALDGHSLGLHVCHLPLDRERTHDRWRKYHG